MSPGLREEDLRPCAGRGGRAYSAVMRPEPAKMRLGDGRTVVLRTAGPADAPAIACLYRELSPESARSRFQSGPIPPGLLAQFAEVRPGTACIVATAPDGKLAAEARYVPTGDGVAELAVTVRDSYQGAGLGRVLLAALAGTAREAGLDRLQATVLIANSPMLRLLQRYGWALCAPTDGGTVACLEISVAGGMPGWPAGSAGRRVLVERRGWFEDARTEQLRSEGNEVRVCTGPLRRTGRACPLVTSGQCRLAEGADLIVTMLPGTDAACAEVRAAHERRWPERLAR